MTNEQLYLAESVADYLSNQDWLNHFDMLTLAAFRDDLVCKNSDIGSHACCVKTSHGYCCDTCLQNELHKLWEVGVSTIGSCCGHGRKLGYIQVTSKDVQKMHELGYEEYPVAKNGDGQWCFRPKTYLPRFYDSYKRREDGGA